MAGEDKSKRKVWTQLETKGLLKCYHARKEEFMHQRKKRNAYAHILEDMLAEGFTDPSTTVIALENKMRTLLSAYKCAKDNASRTGASPCIAPYMEEMEEIFGSSVLAGSNHTVTLGILKSKPLPTVLYFSSDPSASQNEATVPSQNLKATAASIPQPLQSSLTISAHAFPTQQPSLSLSNTAPNLNQPTPSSSFVQPSPTPFTVISNLNEASPPVSLTPQPSLSSAQAAINLYQTLPLSQSEHQSQQSSPNLQPSPSSLTPPLPVLSNRRRKTARERFYEEQFKLQREKLQEKRRFHDSVLQMMEKMEGKRLKILKRYLRK